MIKPLTNKEIENIEKNLKMKKWGYPIFIISSVVNFIAGSMKIYAINQVCEKVSGLTWSLIFEISFFPKTNTKYYGGVVQVSHWLYISIAYYAVALLMAFFLFLLIQQNRRAYLLVELYKNGKSNKSVSPNG